MCESIMTETISGLKMSSQITYCMEHHPQRIHERIRRSLLVFGVDGSVGKVVVEAFVVLYL